MSLVSDALRKARQERAERSARERGVGLPLNQDHRRTGRFAVPVMIGMILAIAAGVAGGVVAWWLLGPGEQERFVAEAAPTTATGGPVQDTVEGNIESNAQAEGTVGQVPEPPSKAPIAASMPYPEETTADFEPVEQPAERQAKPVPRKEESRDFVAEGRIGEVTLSLGYIVFRETDPFAEINGVTTFAGSEVSGFRVEEIHRDRVVLSNQDGPVVIRVR